MGVAISLIVTILENLNGFLKTDKELIKMAKTFKANRFQILTKIVIPANISTFINSLKVNIGLSLVGVISGEFLVSKAGLGYLIVYGGQVFKLDLVMTRSSISSKRFLRNAISRIWGIITPARPRLTRNTARHWIALRFIGIL